MWYFNGYSHGGKKLIRGWNRRLTGKSAELDHFVTRFHHVTDLRSSHLHIFIDHGFCIDFLMIGERNQFQTWFTEWSIKRYKKIPIVKDKEGNNEIEWE